MSPENTTTTRLVAGRYRLGEILGRGGVGDVWRAWDELLRREVAVKEIVFSPTLSEHDRTSMQERVLREARAAAGLPHTAVVTVYDVIRDEARGYIVMELIVAPSLTELVERRGALPIERVAKIAYQMVEVLSVAHDHGIIHRDVKPGNVMVLPNDAIKLADFGIAWIKDDPKITATGLVLGSPSFMAPEQAQGMQSTPATDMWGLGATMYYAVEGELPFDKGQAIATLTSVMADAPRPPRQAGALAPVIAALLSKDPGARPHASDVKRLLDPIAGRETAIPARPRDDQAVAPTALASSARAAGVVRSPRQRYDAAPIGAPEAASDVAGRDLPGRWPPDSVSRSGPVTILAVVVGIAALFGALFLITHLNGARPRLGPGAAQHKHNAKHERVSQTQPSAASTTPATTSESSGSIVPSAPAGSASRVPSGWVSYTHPSIGWSISYPPSWTLQQRDSHDLDFTDPSGTRYLRVAWTTTPGADPAARWKEYSRSFGSRYSHYQTVSISPNFTFKGWTASAWEYRYSAGGAMLHAVDLALVNGTYGFALNFQTHDSDWASSQDIFDAFKASFHPPA